MKPGLLQVFRHEGRVRSKAALDDGSRHGEVARLVRRRECNALAHEKANRCAEDDDCDKPRLREAPNGRVSFRRLDTLAHGTRHYTANGFNLRVRQASIRLKRQRSAVFDEASPA